MFKKFKNILNRQNQINKKSKTASKPKPLLLPNYDRRINYNPDLKDDDVFLQIRKTDAYNKKGDKQLTDIEKAKKYIIEGKIDQGLKIYNKVLLEDGLCLNSQGIVMAYPKHLYNLGKYDEAWSVLNQYVLKYPSLEDRYQNFRVKILKKEKRFKDALYHQVLAILFDNIHFRAMPQNSYEKKYITILKRLKKEDKTLELQQLINRYTDLRRYEQREIRDDLTKIIIDE